MMSLDLTSDKLRGRCCWRVIMW